MLVLQNDQNEITQLTMILDENEQKKKKTIN